MGSQKKKSKSFRTRQESPSATARCTVPAGSGTGLRLSSLEITIQEGHDRSQHDRQDPAEKKDQISHDPDPFHRMEGA